MDLKLIQLLLQNCKITSEKPLLIGVSGGVDSLCLLDILHRLGYPVIAAHFNHQIRLEAGADEAAVKDICKEMGVSLITGRADVPEMAARAHLSLEEAARKVRYTFLFTEARKTGAQAVAVAHHADDQVETILMHFLRGSGLAGLRGMQARAILPEWDESIPLIRPLLNIERSEIEKYCEERDLHPQQDESNLDVRYFRNRLRHELIPALESYNPNFKAGLGKMATVLAGEETLLEEMTIEAWSNCCRQVDDAVIQIEPERFTGYPRPLQRRLLRYAVKQLLPDLRDLDFDAVKRCLNFLDQTPRRGKVDVVAGLSILAEQDAWFVVSGEVSPTNEGYAQVQEGQVIELPLAGEVDLGDGWYIRTEEVEWIGEIRNTGKDQVWLDASIWAAKPVIRRVQLGERFFPLGLEGHSVKLADLFTNQHIPRRARPGWPVLACKEGICWVVGLSAGEVGKISTQTRRVIFVKLDRR